MEDAYSDDERSVKETSKFDENSFLAMMTDMKTLIEEEKKEKEENELNLGIFLIKMDAMRKESKKDIDFALKFLSEDVKAAISRITDIDVLYLPYFNENIKALERISRRIDSIHDEGNKLSQERYEETFMSRSAEISKLEKKTNDIIKDTLQKLRDVEDFRYFFDKLSANMSTFDILNKYLEITQIPVEGILDIILEQFMKSNFSPDQVLKTLNTSLNKAGSLNLEMGNFFSLLSNFKKKIETELKTRGFNDYILKKLYPIITDIFYDYKDLLTKNLEKWIEINTIHISAIETMIDMYLGQKNTKISIYIKTIKDVLQNMKDSLKGKVNFNDVLKYYQKYITYVKKLEDYLSSI
jgi:hypothetical protein